MTREEYKEYEKAVADFFTWEGVEGLSPVYDEDGDYEPYFSHKPCECCRRALGSDRYIIKAYHKDTDNIFEYAICSDCLYYTTYGQLDDMP